jgi:hypothetical protein
MASLEGMSISKGQKKTRESTTHFIMYDAGMWRKKKSSRYQA